MYKKSLSTFLIITLVLFAFQSQPAHAAPIVSAVTSAINTVVDTVTTVTNFVLNTVSVAVDVAAVVVVSIATVGVCSPAGPCNVLNPFLADLNCRQVIGFNPAPPGSINCSGQNVVNSSGSLLNPAATFSSSTASPTCTSLTFSGINPQGHNYAVLRDGVKIKQLTSADTGFTDSGLTPHTTYSYVVRIPDPTETGFKTSDSAPLSAYTKCLPQCGFGVDSSSIATYGATSLRWTCNYNDPAVDTGSCKITDSKGASQTVNAVSGIVQVAPAATTTYTLTCTNVDGPVSIPQTVSIFTPGIKEIKP